MPDERKKYLYAFDLSMDCSGLTIFDMDTQEHVLITSFPMKRGLDHGTKLRTLEVEILKLMKQYPPTEVAMEGAFIAVNSKAGKYQQQVMFNSAQALFEVHGVIKCRFWNFPLYTYQPSTIKLVVAGHGRADKDKVRASIKKAFTSLEFTTFDDSDQSDSYAIGITHFVKKYNMPWKKPTVTKDDVKSAKKTTTKKTTSKTKTSKTKKKPS